MILKKKSSSELTLRRRMEMNTNVYFVEQIAQNTKEQIKRYFRQKVERELLECFPEFKIKIDKNYDSWYGNYDLRFVHLKKSIFPGKSSLRSLASTTSFEEDRKYENNNNDGELYDDFYGPYNYKVYCLWCKRSVEYNKNNVDLLYQLSVKAFKCADCEEDENCEYNENCECENCEDDC